MYRISSVLSFISRILMGMSDALAHTAMALESLSDKAYDKHIEAREAE